MTRRSRTGRTLSNAEPDAIAAEVEPTDYDAEPLQQQREPGRPAMGSGPAEVVPVWIDPELRAAIEERAETESTATSAVIREAMRNSWTSPDTRSRISGVVRCIVRNRRFGVAWPDVVLDLDELLSVRLASGADEEFSVVAQ